MSPTQHPTQTDAEYQGLSVDWSRDLGRNVSWKYRGTSDQVEAKAAAIASTWALLGRQVSNVKYSTANGRGELEASFTRGDGVVAGGNPENGVVEELYGVDVIKDVRTAPAFESIGAYALNVVYSAWEGSLDEDSAWTDTQKLLYRMLSHGQESYIETAFVYRRTYFKATSDNLQLSFDGINRVDADFSGLTSRMKKLIKALPTGEWMKKPPQTEYVSGGVFRLAQDWMWAEKWSNLYGGTLTYGITLP